MRKLVGYLIVATAISATAAFAAGTAGPGDGVVGSVHDMNNISGLTQDSQGRVCAFCHTPHHAIADPTGENQPLWSHNYTSIVNNFVAYQSPTFQGDVTDPLMGPSRLCMSCHDGVVAADQHYGGSQGGTNGRLSSDDWNGVAIGKATDGGMADFSNDHPIGFSYLNARQAENGALGGSGLRDPATTSFSAYGGANLTIAQVLLNGEFLTCASCHDVHNKDNKPEIAGYAESHNYLTYAPQAKSRLCLTCHDKGDPTKSTLP